MAEQSILWETVSGVGDSQSAGYDQTLMFQLFRSLFARTANLGGVSPEYQNELVVSGITSPITVNTGAALVYGIPYVNTTSVSVPIPTPSLSTRIDRIVLRASWAARTVRIVRIVGTEGSGAPSLTQSAGTTWDVPLAQVSITTGGIITVFDQREWLGGVGNNVVSSSKLATDAVTTTKVADNAITQNKLADNAVATSKVLDGAITNAKLGSMAQNTLKGRVSAGVGVAEDLSAAQVLSLLGLTWQSYTPNLTFGGNAVGMTYASQQGAYFIIGSLIFLHVYLWVGSKGSSVGQAKISLPGGVTLAAFGQGYLGTVARQNIGGNEIHAYGVGSTLELRWRSANPGASGGPVANTDFNDGSLIEISFFGRMA